MNNDSQNASDHQQFVASYHYQRICPVPCVIQYTLVNKQHADPSGYASFDPEFATAIVITGDTPPVNYSRRSANAFSASINQYGFLELQPEDNAAKQSWTFGGSLNSPAQLRCGESDRASTGKYNGYGIYSLDYPGSIPSIAHRMKLWYPIRGAIGYYDTGDTDDLWGGDFELQSSEEIAPTLGTFFEITLDEPSASTGKYRSLIAMVFFGVDESEIPATIPADAVFVSGFTFP